MNKSLREGFTFKDVTVKEVTIQGNVANVILHNNLSDDIYGEETSVSTYFITGSSCSSTGIFLKPGETKTVSFNILSSDESSHFSGCYKTTITIGSSAKVNIAFTL